MRHEYLAKKIFIGGFVLLGIILAALIWQTNPPSPVHSFEGKDFHKNLRIINNE